MRLGIIKSSKLLSSFVQVYHSFDLKHPFNTTLTAFINYRGFNKNAYQRDFSFLLIFLAVLVFIGSLSGIALMRFSIERLRNPWDFRGDMCGIDQLHQKPYIYWPNPAFWGDRVKLCLEDCPTELQQELCFYTPNNLSYYEEYCFLTFNTKKVGKVCMIQEISQMTAVKDYLKSGMRIINTATQDFISIIYLIPLQILLTLLLRILFRFIQSLFLKNINKLFIVFLIFFNFISIYPFITLTNSFNDQLNQYCLNEDFNCQSNNQWNIIIYYSLLALLNLFYLIQILVKIKKIMRQFKICQISNFSIFNRHQLLNDIVYYIIQILLLVLSVCFLIVLSSSGGVYNFSTSGNFDSKEVRDYDYYWINWVVLLLMVLFISYLIHWIYLSHYFVNCSIFGQWFFNKNKPWLKKQFWKSLKPLSKAQFSIGQYSIQMFFFPFSLITGFVKGFVDKIEIAKIWHMIFIYALKPLIFLDNYYFKYNTDYVVLDLALFSKKIKEARLRSYYLLFRHREKYSKFQNDFQGVSMIIFIAQILIMNSTSVALLQNFNLSDKPLGDYYFLLEIMVIKDWVLVWVFGAENSIQKLSQKLFYCLFADREMHLISQRFVENQLENFMEEQTKKIEVVVEKDDSIEQIAKKRRTRKNMMDLINQNNQKIQGLKKVKKGAKKEFNLKGYIEEKKMENHRKFFNKIKNDYQNESSDSSGDSVEIDPNSYAAELIRKMKKNPVMADKVKKQILFDSDEEKDKQFQQFQQF